MGYGSLAAGGFRKYHLCGTRNLGETSPQAVGKGIFAVYHHQGLEMYPKQGHLADGLLSQVKSTRVYSVKAMAVKKNQFRQHMIGVVTVPMVDLHHIFCHEAQSTVRTYATLPFQHLTTR